jgi:tRNA (cmo5U34)-methyltransferase
MGKLAARVVRVVDEWCSMSQFHWDPSTYLKLMAKEVPDYTRVQDEVAAAAAPPSLAVRAILELGTGTGETARRVLATHPGAMLHGIDSSPEMLAVAREALTESDVTLEVGRIEDPLPAGPFDLVVSALAIHHLPAEGKEALFARIARVLVPGGRFVLADVVIPVDPADALTPIDEGYDMPDSIADQLSWLSRAGLRPAVHWAHRDLAVLVADRV